MKVRPEVMPQPKRHLNNMSRMKNNSFQNLAISGKNLNKNENSRCDNRLTLQPVPVNSVKNQMSQS